MTKRIFGVVMAAIYLALTGCASLGGIFNPIHAVGADGEKTEASFTFGGKKVKIGGAEYAFLDRPTVPPPPQEPKEPKKPVEPATPVKPSGTAPSQPIAPTRPTKPAVPQANADPSAFLNPEYSESESRYLVAMEKYNRDYKVYEQNLQIYNNYQNAMQKYEQDVANVNRYNSDMAVYRTNFANYQQDMKEYEKEYASYQAHLPEYQAKVDEESRIIQDAIFPDAPEGWDKYIEGKYLLYKGK